MTKLAAKMNGMTELDQIAALRDVERTLDQCVLFLLDHGLLKAATEMADASGVIAKMGSKLRMKKYKQCLTFWTNDIILRYNLETEKKNERTNSRTYQTGY